MIDGGGPAVKLSSLTVAFLPRSCYNDLQPAMLPQAIVNGLLFGSVYATIGIGFSLVWGVMNIINVAHGSFIMIGAYLSYTLFALYGLDPFLSIPPVMAVLFLLAYAIQKYVLNRVVRGSVFITLTFTFGLQILIANLCLLLWSADSRSIKLPYSSAGWQIGGLVIPLVRLGIFGVALLLTGLFYLFMRRTKTGVAINATALNFEGAKTVGIDVYNIYAITFGVSAALAGVRPSITEPSRFVEVNVLGTQLLLDACRRSGAAGCLISPIMSINPFGGGPLVAKAFVIAILGGLGSTVGALVGGLALGLVETVGTVFISSSFQVLPATSVYLLSINSSIKGSLLFCCVISKTRSKRVSPLTVTLLKLMLFSICLEFSSCTKK